MDDRTKLLNKVNDSDKPGQILPHAAGHTHGGSDAEPSKCKRYKWWIVGGVAVVAIIAIILGVTLGKKKKDDPDQPNPPTPPSPPVPANYNPYVVQTDLNMFDEGILTGFMSVPNSLSTEQPDLTQDLAAVDVKPRPRDIPVGQNNALFTNVSFEIGQVDYKWSYMIFSKADNTSRFSIPEDQVNKSRASYQMKLEMVGFELFTNPFGFHFKSTRYEDNVLLSTDSSSFVMTDKYMQLDLQLPSRRIYGLGERVHEFSLQEGAWTMWANGQRPAYDTGEGGGNSYGVHPFALVQTKVKGEYLGIYFRNSGAQSPVIRYTGDDTATLSYIAIGGNIEMYLFFKGSAKEIIAAYQTMIGRPQLPPLYSLGWHAGGSAFTTQAEYQANIDAYQAADIPLENVWIDFLQDGTDFIVDPAAFTDMSTFVANLHNKDQKVLIGLRPGLSSETGDNKYYSAALQQNLLLNSTLNAADREGKLTQKLSSGRTVFLDFLDQGSAAIWKQGLEDLQGQFGSGYDGVYLDMNEATGMCDGECPSGKVPEYKKPDVQNNTWYTSYTSQDSNSTFDLPFIPGPQWNLDNMTISLNATHPNLKYNQYDTHSLFGHSQGKMTKEQLEALDTQDLRQLVVSRSTFVGSGVYMQHFHSRNSRTWDDMKYSISLVMNFNMFGIPMTGPDTCGFFGDKDQDELCGRWYQLAQFYPLARQDRALTGGDPTYEPYALKDPYKTWAKNAIHARYNYVRLLYSCLYSANTTGGTCFDPLLLHYPQDDEVFKPDQTEHSFIFADAIKVTPVLQAGVTEVPSYFPQEDAPWVNLNDLTKSVDSSAGGKWVNLTTDPTDPNDRINAHLRPGKLIPYVYNETAMIKTTTQGNLAPIEVWANRDQIGQANGKLFLDGGASRSELENLEYEYFDLHLSKNSLKRLLINDQIKQANSHAQFKRLVILNAEDIQHTDFACVTNFFDNSATAITPQYDPKLKTLNLTLPKDGDNYFNFFNMRDIHFGQTGKDINVCEPSTNYYRTKDGQLPDLSKNTVSVDIESLTPDAARDLTLTLSVLKTGSINVHWTFQNTTKLARSTFEIPTQIVDPKKDELEADAKLSDFVTITQDAAGPMVITIMNSAKVPTYRIDGFQLTEYFNYIEASALTDSTNYQGVMGLSEQISDQLFLKDGVYSLWAMDQSDPIQDQKPPGKNMYNVQPYYMARATDQSWFGVYTNIANAQDWWIKNDNATGVVKVKFYATGGVGDLYILQSTEPEKVTKLLHNVLGNPVLIPQWVLGWHQCRWGYKTIDILKEVVANYSTYNLPLDTQWSDIDYLLDYRDFSYDPDRYKGLPEFIDDLHSKGMNWIPILDSGVAQRVGMDYHAYDTAADKDVFIKDYKGEVFSAQVWPVDAAFPDFFQDKTKAWWKDMLTYLHDTLNLKFDGLWHDMNEPTNFCNGPCYDSQRPKEPIKYKLPYSPTARDLESKVISLDAQYLDGSLELDSHSLYANSMVESSHQWFQENQKRTMIISRSGFAGLGKYGSRWMGDNHSFIEHLAYSIPSMMLHNIMGLHFHGSDICGFMGNTTPELCARWYVTGAFYPFSRNHNNLYRDGQEPWNFITERYESSTTYFDIIKMAMQTKLHLIRYYYTQLSFLSTTGGTFFKPMFFEFPADALAYENIPLNAMLGKALKLGTQTLALNQNTTDFFFPAGTWCEVFNKQGTQGCIVQATAGTVTLASKAYDFHLHLREGYVIPIQDATSLHKAKLVNTTRDLQKYGVEFHMLPSCDDSKCTAAGDYLNDDGTRLDKLNEYQNIYNITYNSANTAINSITVDFARHASASGISDGHVNNNDLLTGIQIYNAAGLQINADFTVKSTDQDDKTTDLADAKYDAKSDRLVFA